MPKCLVTGSNGFVGTHLVERWEQSGYTVIRGDRHSTVPKVDKLIDVASYGNLWSQTDSKKIHEVNVERVSQMLEQTDNYNEAIVTSSSSVTMGHLTPYAASKREMEIIANFYGATIIRPYTVFGIGDNKAHLIPTVFRSCLTGEAMELDPKPTHDYIYIDDLVDLYLDPPSKLVEAGTGIATTNGDIVLMIQEITGKIANIVKLRDNTRPYDSLEWKAPRAIKEDMTTIKEGLIKVYEHYQYRVKEKNHTN